MARHQLELIAEAAIERFKLSLVRLHHRIGFVRAGEASLLLNVASAHRGPAFEAATWIVSELKQKVPIWKSPRFQEKISSMQTEPQPEEVQRR
jgi:molybdopterin synthase catalytic subunit